jgi:hypothetical protein
VRFVTTMLAIIVGTGFLAGTLVLGDSLGPALRSGTGRGPARRRRRRRAVAREDNAAASRPRRAPSPSALAEVKAPTAWPAQPASCTPT